MTDSTPPVLAALERAALTSLAVHDVRLLRELLDILAGAIVRGNELDPETTRKIAEMLGGEGR